MSLKIEDPFIYELLKKEKKRQNETLQMIASENHVSTAVMEAVGSELMNKYSEGYAGKRYYQGNDFIDQVELLAIDRAKQLFNVDYVNVQPYSGSPANSEVFFALLEPGDTVIGMALQFGGHLTHGHPKVTLSGKYFNSVQYGLNEKGQIDYDEIARLVKEHKPKLLISGASAYPREIDFKRIGEIAESVGAYHMADISHIAGLVAGGVHMSPVPYAHVITTTTHKTMRGPRGAMIMVTKKGLEKDSLLPSKIDKAVFPGMQGGPHNNTTAGIAVALNEALAKDFRKYASYVVENAKILSAELMKFGFDIYTGGTDNHLLLIDLNNKNIDGWCTAWALEYAGIILNRNAIPYDKRSAFYPSGIRLGTAGLTTRGMKSSEMKKIASWINIVVNEAVKLLPKDIDVEDKSKSRMARSEFQLLCQKSTVIKDIAKEVKTLCLKFPLN